MQSTTARAAEGHRRPRYTSVELEKLRQLMEANRSFEEIALSLGRTPSAIRMKAYAEGLLRKRLKERESGLAGA